MICTWQNSFWGLPIYYVNKLGPTIKLWLTFHLCVHPRIYSVYTCIHMYTHTCTQHTRARTCVCVCIKQWYQHIRFMMPCKFWSYICSSCICLTWLCLASLTVIDSLFCFYSSYNKVLVSLLMICDTSVA